MERVHRTEVSDALSATVASLRAHGERLRAVLSCMNEGLVVHDGQGAIEFCNPAAERILGLGFEQLAGRSPLDPRWRAVRSDGSAFPGEEHPAALALRSGEAQEQVVMGVYRPDGSLAWISIDALPVFEPASSMASAVVVTFREINAERGRIEELRRNRAVVHAVLENLPAGFYVIDERDERVLALNALMCRIWKIEDLEPALRSGDIDNRAVIARLLPNVVDAEGFAAVSRALREPGALGVNEYEFSLRDGRRLHRVSKRLFDADGGYVGRLFLFEDITRYVAAEEERRTIERRMQEVRRLESLGVLAGGIAHDFNNLLTSIVGNAELARGDALEAAPLRRQMERVIEASARATELCRKMLSFAGTDQGAVRRVHLSDLVHTALRWLQPQLSTRIHLHEELARELPSVLGDPLQLNQVIVNLVLNACEALGESGGNVRVVTGTARRDPGFFARAVLAPDLPEGEYVHVEIADDGCGIEPAVLARIFDPFYSTKFDGRGLGLSAVLGIVRGHRGAIQVESTPGSGTRMCVVFPSAAVS